MFTSQSIDEVFLSISDVFDES